MTLLVTAWVSRPFATVNDHDDEKVDEKTKIYDMIRRGKIEGPGDHFLDWMRHINQHRGGLGASSRT